jgi:hypothetical protein
MTEPITTAIIVGLAAQKFAEGAAGKSAEKLVERLWDAIVTRFKGDKRAETALKTVETTKGSQDSLETLTTYVKEEMKADQMFADDVQQLAQQIVNIQNQSQSQQNNANYGRDQIIINQPTGDLKIGGS